MATKFYSRSRGQYAVFVDWITVGEGHTMYELPDSPVAVPYCIWKTLDYILGGI
jgi:hypothetical protein